MTSSPGELLCSMMRNGNDIEEEHQTMRLCRLGDRGSPFTSMVRWFAEGYLGDPWHAFDRLPP
ncbi:MAG TPA: hypothetical protein PKA58_00315 [Polyangium sp.]|nr:hypothetical protein [Polyangium sp.]